MYRVLIVDDEKVIRMAMKSIIHWEDYNYQVVGVAADGKIALDMIDDLKPDLIITDLKMPNVDGIELIKEVKRKGFDCKILVLSNYGDFELVRVAMKEGAVDYLLKVTLSPKELINVLENIEDMLKKESKEKEHRIQLEKEIYENKYLIKRSFFLNLIEGEGEEKDKLKAAYDKYSLQCFEKVNILLHIRIDNISQIYSEKIKDKNQLVVAITNMIDETIPKKYKREILHINHHKYIVLISFEDKHYEDIESITESLSKTIRFYLNITATIVISNEFNGIHELKEAYDRCNELSKWKFYFGYNSIVKAHCNGDFNKFNYEYLELSKKIKELIDLGDFDKSLEIVENFLELCAENSYDPQDIKKFIIFIASYIEGYEIDKGINDLSSIENIKNDILNCELLDKLKELTKNLFDNLKLLMKEANSNKYRKEVEVVIDYINQNINEKITLKMVAQAVNMNESYLSRMFKNETGKNLIYFINEIKMKRALELLKESGSMVKEVANIVGIEDQFYFNKVFKKFYGVSPSEFKKKYFDK